LGLSGIETLEDIVNRSASIGGCPVCVNAAYTDDDYVAGWGVSERVIYDVSDWDNSLSIHTTGQSGHPYSAQYDSMLSSWSDIEFKPMVWSRDAVEAVSVKQLTLVP
jgi:penicillin amidase